MQPYTVLWSPRLDDHILGFWLEHPQARHAISTAVNKIDAELRRSPHTCGENLFDIMYALRREPLYVQYEVNDGDRKVIVLAVWYLPDERS